MSVCEFGVYLAAQFGHLTSQFAAQCSAERVHVGSGDELRCRGCGEQFHEVVRLFGSDGVFESVEDVASVLFGDCHVQCLSSCL